MKNERKDFKCATWIILLFAVLAAVMEPMIIAPVTAYAAEDYAEGEALVVLKNGIGTLNVASISSAASRNYVSSVAASVGAEAPVTYKALSAASGKVITLMKSATQSTEELIADLKKNPNVLNASPNYRVYALATPNDQYYNSGSLWGLRKIRADKAWEVTTGSDNVYVAVMDTGIDPYHDDLAANFDANLSKNFTSSSSTPAKDDRYTDGDGHGTHVSGTIAAVGNNNRGVVGVNWKAKIIALKVLDDNGKGYNSYAVAALEYLAELLHSNPGLVLPAVNLSLGFWANISPDDYINDPYWLAFKAIDQTNRTVIVVAAGNEYRQVGAPAAHANPRFDVGRGDYQYPGSFKGLDNMIVVGSIDMNDRGARDTNWSSKAVHVVAPGVDILSTALGNRYSYLSGTSMAAPHVTGAVALLASVHSNHTPFTANALKRLICENANPNINPKAMAIDVALMPPVPISPQDVADATMSMYGLLDVEAAVYAIVEPGRPRSSDDESGGCNAGFTIFAAVALCALAARKGATRR